MKPEKIRARRMGLMMGMGEEGRGWWWLAEENVTGSEEEKYFGCLGM